MFFFCNWVLKCSRYIELICIWQCCLTVLWLLPNCAHINHSYLHSYLYWYGGQYHTSHHLFPLKGLSNGFTEIIVLEPITKSRYKSRLYIWFVIVIKVFKEHCLIDGLKRHFENVKDPQWSKIKFLSVKILNNLTSIIIKLQVSSCVLKRMKNYN